MREEQDVANGCRVREEHNEPVDADTNASRWRHAVLESPNVIVIEGHGLIITRFTIRDLCMKSIRLLFGIIELRKSVGDFTSGNEKLEAIGDKRVVVVATR